MKGLRLFVSLLLFSTITYAQGSGTPSTLRVLTDANGYLAIVGGAQTSPLSQPTVFSNTRLKTDASGYLLVVITGGTITGPIFAPTQADCSVVSYSFVGRTTTGLNSHAANTWNLCGGGTLGLSGNTTDVTSSLQLTVPKLLFSTNLGSINPASNGVFTLLDTAGTSFGRLQLGGTTSSFPAIKRSSTTIAFRLADDSADAPISFSTGTSSANIDTGQDFRFIDNTRHIIWISRAHISSTADGRIILRNAALDNFDLLQFGGTSTSFPSLKRSTTNLFIRLADDSAAGGLGFVSLAISGTAPTVPVACTTPTVTWSNGTATFQMDVGTTCAAVTTLSFTMPAATNKWSCDAKNLSNSATSTPWQSAGTTTSVTITNYSRTTGIAAAWTDGDDILFTCTGG